MHRIAQSEIKRISQMLSRDKFISPSRFEELIKNESYPVLSSFFDIEKERLNVSISMNDDGTIDFVLHGNAKRMIKPTIY